MQYFQVCQQTAQTLASSGLQCFLYSALSNRIADCGKTLSANCAWQPTFQRFQDFAESIRVRAQQSFKRDRRRVANSSCILCLTVPVALHVEVILELSKSAPKLSQAMSCVAEATIALHDTKQYPVIAICTMYKLCALEKYCLETKKSGGATVSVTQRVSCNTLPSHNKAKERANRYLLHILAICSGRVSPKGK